MNRPKWFRVGPTETEAYHGPFLARMRPEDSVWFVMVVFRGGVWQHTTHATRAKLKRIFVEECERYELEQDRARLDFLNAHPHRLDIAGAGNKTWWQCTDAAGVHHVGADVRAAVDAARMAHSGPTTPAQAGEA